MFCLLAHVSSSPWIEPSFKHLHLFNDLLAMYVSKLTNKRDIKNTFCVVTFNTLWSSSTLFFFRRKICFCDPATSNTTKATLYAVYLNHVSSWTEREPLPELLLSIQFSNMLYCKSVNVNVGLLPLCGTRPKYLAFGLLSALAYLFLFHKHVVFPLSQRRAKILSK